MARALAGETDRNEDEFALEFEEPVLLTLGPCYETNGRFSGSAYRPALLRVEAPDESHARGDFLQHLGTSSVRQ